MTTKKVFMPRWMMWFGTTLVVLMWILVTYLTFFGEDSPGLVVYGIISAFMVGIAVMMVQMGRRRLPMYIIEEDEEDR